MIGRVLGYIAILIMWGTWFSVDDLFCKVFITLFCLFWAFMVTIEGLPRKHIEYERLEDPEIEEPKIYYKEKILK
jgi:hypothetical protein